MPAQQKMMNAYRHKPTSNEPVHEIMPIPEPGEGEVLLKIQAAGLCHSDLHILEHHVGIKAIDEGTFTFCHELSGTIVKNGPNSNGKLGQLVVVLGMNPCLKCKACQQGRHNMCKSDRQMIGLGADGAKSLVQRHLKAHFQKQAMPNIAL